MKSYICPVCRAVRFAKDNAVIVICEACSESMEESFEGGQGIELKKDEGSK